jgi:hypothetical protein
MRLIRLVKIALLAFLQGCVVAVIEEPNNRPVDDASHSFLQVSSESVEGSSD